MDDSAKKVVISLGGSMVVPNGAIDAEFLKRFIDMVRAYVEQGYRFCVIVGGGSTARAYQQALQQIAIEDTDALDWVGIYATHLNAQLVRIGFGELAAQEIQHHPFDFSVSGSVVVGGGHKPGHSSDMGAVEAAVSLGASKVINLSGVDYVYSADPQTNPEAEKYSDLTWSQYLQIIPNDWQPGMSAPFDPIASKKAHEQNISVGMIDGHNLDSVQKCIAGEAFEGTLLHS
jgi:uridylate kinase